MQYLRDHHHPYADVFLQYPNAGHLFLFASQVHPMTTSSLGRVTLLVGGTAQGNVAAAQAAWPRIEAFLEVALHPG